VPLYREHRARAHTSLADVLKELGKPDEAEVEYRRAIARWKQLTANFPVILTYRQDLANTHKALGKLLHDRGKAKAEPEYRRAIAAWKRLSGDFPTVPAYRLERAKIHDRLGLLLVRLGKPEAAQTEHRRAIALFGQLAAASGRVPVYRDGLAASRNNLGTLLRDLGQQAAAEAEIRQALALQKQLAADFPSVTDYQYKLAACHGNLAILLKRLGKLSEAEANHRQGVAILKRLAADCPGVPEHRRSLARAHLNLGGLLGTQRNLAEAEAEKRLALALYKQLVADFPSVPDYRQELAASHVNLAVVLSDLGKWAEAEAESRQAIDLLKRLAGDFPSVPAYRIHLALARTNLGFTVQKAGRPADALPLYEQAIKALAPLEAKKLRLTEARNGLCRAHRNRAEALMKLERFAEAVRDWDQAFALEEESIRSSGRFLRALCLARTRPARAVAEADALIKEEPLPPGSLYQAAQIYAVSFAQVKDTAAKKEYGARAVALLNRARATGYFRDKAWLEYLKTDPDLDHLRQREDFRKLLAEAVADHDKMVKEADAAAAHNKRGNGFFGQGKFADAEAEYRKAIGLRPDNAVTHYFLGNALLHQKKLDEAIRHYRKSLTLNPEFPESHCNLGHALRDQGCFVEALAELKKGHELGSKRPKWPYASAQWVTHCQRLAELDARLPAILKGEARARDWNEHFEFARLCSLKQLSAAAARLYQAGLSSKPKWTGFRFSAACAAVLAGCGKGQDAARLDAKDRAHWRQQALEWLRADLDMRRKQLGRDSPQARKAVQATAEFWKGHAGLAGIRDKAALAGLPPTERQAWQQFWLDVEALLRQARQGQPPR
jgi:tetratricopeptide (TPR) repeat protein